jgi:hypothetical protein
MTNQNETHPAFSTAFKTEDEANRALEQYAKENDFNIDKVRKNSPIKYQKKTSEVHEPEYDSPHWDDPNVLAHLRLSDRSTPQGKMLHVEEMQSDWHQQGRKHGYKGESADEESVPDAPFKKSWHELALKRALLEAANGGYKGLVITPGEEQNKRYSLSKHIDQLQYGKNEDGTYDLFGTKGGQNILTHSGLKPDELDNYVGKEVANRILSGAGEKSTARSRFKPHAFARDYNTLEGLDLEVGGQGMKGFYDKIVPDYLNKLGKKYGVKTQQMPMKLDRSNDQFHDLMRRHTGMTLRDWDNLPQEERGRLTPEILASAKNQQTNLHHFPITEEMRQDIKQNGLPMYKKGGGLKLLPTKFKE